MKRQIIKINEDLCDGCGLCVQACHEGAIDLLNGKAVLIRDDYCDGLGNCLPVCPTGAISFEEREALPFDEAAVKANELRKQAQHAVSKSACSGSHGGHKGHGGGCPGSNAKRLVKNGDNTPNDNALSGVKGFSVSRLSQWPVQIKLVPVNAPYFNGAKLLIAADCSAFAYANFHEKFIKNHIALIGCPKLDMIEYAEKLTEILRHNDIKSVSVVRMEVPCCGGIEHAAKQALQNSGKFIPWQVHTISVNGELLD